MIQKNDPEKLQDANIGKYYSLTLTLSLSKKGRGSSLVQKREKKNVKWPMFIYTTYRVVYKVMMASLDWECCFVEINYEQIA